MRKGIFLVAVPVLVSATPPPEITDPFDRAVLEKMGVYDGDDPNEMPATELPDHPLRCEFQHRSVCAGGEACKPIGNDNATYIVVSKPDMTYSRCDNKGCGVHKITAIGAPQVIRNVVLADAGVVLKFGPRDRVIDIATKGSMIFISDGRCSAAPTH